jgi:hypothetical protein
LLVWFSAVLSIITCVADVQMVHARPFWTSTLQGLSNGVKNISMRGVLALEIKLWIFGSPRGLQVPTFGSVNFILTLASKWGCDIICCVCQRTFMLACWANISITLVYSWVFYLVSIHYTLTWWRAMVSKKVNRGYKPKSLYNIYAFEYFAMHVIILIDLYKLWSLIMEYIRFWHFIFISHINYFGKTFTIFFQNPYRFDTICPYEYVLNIFLMLLI